MRTLLAGLLSLILSGSTPSHPDVTVELPDGTPVDFVWIDPGSYVAGLTMDNVGALQLLLGGPFIADVRVEPAVEIDVDAGFYLGRTELTQAQWRAASAVAPWEGKAEAGPNLPASHLGRADVDAWIIRLNASAGDSLFRLPTEAEWEFAARAGATTLWSFGDEPAALSEHAWYRKVSGPQPVATKAPNPWGLYDVHGNVEEWVADTWTGDGLYADCAGVTRGGSFAAGDGHGYLATLPFMRQPRDCGDGEDLALVGVRLVYRGPQASAVPGQTWGTLKVRLRQD